ncbi:MAG: molybdopterin-dependent oxidoreductase, partial [Solobacterium sp.]|nr:molybdopterin-dependent oxidoreductase [Solobacterium sp.]
TFAERTTGYETHERDFMFETYPQNVDRAVGADVHPLWYELRRDMQANDLAQNILNQDEHSIKALYAHGMNYRMFAEDQKWLEAFRKLDFFVDIDLFMTDSAKWADIVLPCCTSLERSEFKGYPGAVIMYTHPVVKPLGESRRDVDIITDLANVMGIDDPVLCSGYENAVKYIFRDVPVDLDKVMADEGYTKIEGVGVKDSAWYMEHGWRTPTGKIELYSEIIGSHPEWGLNPLPSYTPPINPDPEKYPFFLCSGARLPHVIHSRLHASPWERSLLPEPTAEMNPDDCDRLGIEYGDDVEIVTSIGSLKFKAEPTGTILPGQVFVYHGYPEADINSIIPYREICDPYSGYPAYRSVYCAVRKV